ncbi:MAG: hypothetical protein M3Z38_04655 [Bombilactobacillus mellifer]|nr:hypothetical protein [Bombilactobacillus mellifer]
MAFTLIESTITLIITSLLISVSLQVTPKLIHDQAIKNFSSELDHKFNLLKEKALLNNEILLIEFEKKDSIITVKNLKNQNKIIYIRLPKNLVLIRNTQIRFYGDSGISPITISFKDIESNKIYHFTLQMGWGTNSFVSV